MRQMERGVATAGFVAELIRQLRAGDAYGGLDAVEGEALLRPFILSPEARRAIPVFGDVDAAALARLRSFYQAVAAGIERETGAMVSCVLDLSHEGFGRVVIFAGRLVLLDRTLRDAHRFGFPSQEQLAAEGERLVREGVAVWRRFPEVAAV